MNRRPTKFEAEVVIASSTADVFNNVLAHLPREVTASVIAICLARFVASHQLRPGVTDITQEELQKEALEWFWAELPALIELENERIAALESGDEHKTH